MTIQEQLINDIKQLPDDILLELSGIVKKFLSLNKRASSMLAHSSEEENSQNSLSKALPLYGCAKGKVWMSDDFDNPMDEMEDYE